MKTPLPSATFFGILLLLWLPCLVQAQSNILYVDISATGDNTGSDWTSAFTELYNALAWAADEWDGSNPPLQIRVATGRYLSTANENDRNATFRLLNNVEIYGGFAGMEGPGFNLDNRDFEANPAILSGDIDNNDEPFDPENDSDGDPGTPSQTDHIRGNNSYNVVTGSGANATAVLDGFVITAGLANGGVPFNSGGGMIIVGGSPTLNHLTFTDNSAGTFGGGIYNSIGNPTITNTSFTGNNAGGGGIYNLSGNPALTNTTFTDNSAVFSGGGISNNSGNLTLNHLTFTGNSAVFAGGGIYNFSGNLTLTNTGFTGNNAGGRGGGMYIESGSSTLTLNHLTFTDNSAVGSGGGIYNDSDSNLTLTNTILWGNTAEGPGRQMYTISFGDDVFVTLSHSLYSNEEGDIVNEEDGGIITISETATIHANPHFTDPGNRDFSLLNTSPAINTGTNAPFETGGVAAGIIIDLAGNSRIFGGTVDIGAFEFQGEPAQAPNGEDRRILVSSLEVYTFSNSDFSISENVSAVKIETLSGGGSLELGGVVVSEGDQIPVQEIEDGQLTWTPPGSGHGYGYAAIGFRLTDEADKQSEHEATLSIDLAVASLELTGGEGWRFLTSPALGETIGGFLAPVWTQGFPGAKNPAASFSNVQVLDQDAYAWDPGVSAGDAFTRGLGLIAYIFEDHNNDGTEVGFPRTLASGQQWESLENEFEYSGLDFYPAHPLNGFSHVLLANPHPVSLDFCEFTQTNIAASIDVWDPAANGGNGDYINLHCEIDDVFIAPFQGFWVRTTAANPELSIPGSAYKQTPAEGYFKEKDLSGFENLTGLILRIENAAGSLPTR